jgi:hypothetical protein
MTERKRPLIILTVTLAFFMPLKASGSQAIEGRIEALDCIIYGRPCPVDYLDPHIALASDFVLLLGKGDEHYLLPNIPRYVKAKYMGKPVRVTGKVNKNYKAVDAEELELKHRGSYKIIWSKWSQPDDWSQWRKEIYEGRL